MAKTALVMMNSRVEQVLPGATKPTSFEPRETPYRVPVEVAEIWFERGQARPAD